MGRRVVQVVSICVLFSGCAAHRDVAATTSPAASPVRESASPAVEEPAWGPATHGLRIRVRAPESARRGDALRVSVDVHAQREDVPDRVQTLDARGPWYFARLVLSPAAGGSAVTLRCEDPSGGMSDPPLPPLDERESERVGPSVSEGSGDAGDSPPPPPSPERDLRSPWGYRILDLSVDEPTDGQVTFWLASLWDSAPPGRYSAIVELAIDDTAYSHEAQGDWRGVIRSPPFPFEIGLAPEVIQTVELPSEEVGGDAGPPVTLRIPVRNGFQIGLRSARGFIKAWPGPEFAESVRLWTARDSGPFVIYEVAPSPSFLGYARGHGRLYRRLWRSVGATSDD